MRRPRGLRAEELELWQRVRAGVVPLHEAERGAVDAATGTGGAALPEQPSRLGADLSPQGTLRRTPASAAAAIPTSPPTGSRAWQPAADAPGAAPDGAGWPPAAAGSLSGRRMNRAAGATASPGTSQRTGAAETGEASQPRGGGDPASRLEHDLAEFAALLEKPDLQGPGGSRVDLAPGRQALVQPAGLDRRALTRLKRGKLAPEGRIDLHGLTQAQAHLALTGFVLGAQAEGRRLLLVITGKGRGAPGWGADPSGVLRTQVPRWLALPPLAPAVLRLAEAHVSHGGGGALYVWLRRQR